MNLSHQQVTSLLSVPSDLERAEQERIRKLEACEHEIAYVKDHLGCFVAAIRTVLSEELHGNESPYNWCKRLVGLNVFDTQRFLKFLEAIK